MPPSAPSASSPASPCRPAAAETTGPAAARTEKTFLVPSSDGYGVADCLASTGGECGQVVADAWCESQGFSRAVSFGVAAKDEYTGAIEDAERAPPVGAPGPHHLQG